ncbi:hypothetical protein HYS94_03505 [Candidatus Daviesbacteria bacterium]|nr:hypothetical protein [Candidatus Daviesbacteria bacterium]
MINLGQQDQFSQSNIDIAKNFRLLMEKPKPTPQPEVLAVTTAAEFLEINADTQINGDLSVRDCINGIALETATTTVPEGCIPLTVSEASTIDQDLSLSSSPTFASINLSNSSDQIVFQSGGPTGTLTWTPTDTRTITLPDATTTLVGTDTTQTLTNKTLSGSNNTFSNIPNSALSNNKITVSAGTNLTGGGDVSLGGSTTLSLKDSISLSGTLTVSGATTLSSTLTVSGTTTLNAVTYTWPSAQGSSDTFLANNGSGTLSWSALTSAGGWTDDGTTVRLTTITDNVGIGTTSPSYKLHVVGNVGVGGSLTVTSATTLSAYSQCADLANGGKLTVDSSGNLLCQVDSTASLSGGATGGVTYWDSPTTVSQSVANFYWDSTNFRLGIGTSSPGDSLIVASGNVGIGFTTPTAALHVVQVNAANAFRVDDVANDTTPFIIDQTGNVGIGFTTVGAKLDIKGGMLFLDNGDFNETRGLRFRNAANGVSATGGGIYQANNDQLYIQAGSGNYINFRNFASGLGEDVVGISTIGPRFAIGAVGVSQTSTMMAVSGNAGIGLSFAGAVIPANGLAVQGNVGIGITTANSVLTVNGGATIGSSYNTLAPTNGLLVQGNVGIGWTSPTSLLHLLQTSTFPAFRIDDVAEDTTPFIIMDTGNVGIGNTAPAYALDVTGNVGVSQSLTVSTAAILDSLSVTKSISAATLGTTGNVGVGGSLSVSSGVNLLSSLNVTGNTQLSSVAASSNVYFTGLSASSGSALCLNSANQVVTCTVGTGGVSGSGFAGGVAFFDGASNITANHKLFWSNSDARLGIGTSSPGDSLVVASGNVGIGFTTPKASLHIVNANAQDSFRVEDQAEDTSTPFVIDQAGNVGIGTSVPGNYKLNVNGASWLNGSLKLDLGSDATGDVYYRDSNGNFVRLPIGTSGQALGISGGIPAWTAVESFTSAAGWVDAGAYIRLLTMGDNVGIGTTVAQDAIGKLHLRGNDDSTGLTFVTTNNANSEFGLTVLNNGNVGIGTTNPQGGLIVVAGAGNVGIGTSEPGNYRLTVLGDTRISTDGIFTLNLGSDATGDIYYRNSSGNITRLPIGNSGEALGVSNGLPVWTTNLSFTSAAGWVDAGAYIRLLTMGDNVGIGTTVAQDPYAKLHIRANGTGTGLAFLVADNDNVQRFAILDNGNVGIGTTGPGGILVVASGNVGVGFTTPDRVLQLASDINLVGSNASLLAAGGSQFGITGSSATGTQKKLVLGIDTTDNYGVIQAGTLGTNYTLALNPAGGNVGIGTTSPAYPLHSSGNLGIGENIGIGITSSSTRGIYLGLAPLNVELTRVIPNVVNDYVDVGQVNMANGAHNFRISVTNSDNSYSVSKQYLVTINYDQTSNTWQWVTPISDTGAFSSNNHALIVNVNAAIATFRLIRTAGTTAGTAYIRIESVGLTADTFTALSTVGSMTAPTAYLDSSVITQTDGSLIVEGNIGIGWTAATPPAFPRLGLSVFGNIGIGITTANSALTINGGASIGSSFNVTAPTNGLIVQGNVGIGVTSPTAFNLQVAGTIGPNADDTYDLGSSSLRWRDLYLGPSSLNIVCNAAECSSARTWNIGVQEAVGGQGGLRIGLSTARDFLNIDTNGNVGIGASIPQGKLIIQGNVGIGYTGLNQLIPANGLAVSGNVGIGITTANSNLVVAGNAHIGTIYQGISAPTNGLFVDGNVGIGATTSSNALDVWGGARITGTLTIDGSCTGCGGLSGGQSGAVTYWTGANTVSQSVANFYWDSSNNRLGIGTSSPGDSLIVASGNVGIGVTTPTSLLQISLAATGTSVNLSSAASLTSGTAFNISGNTSGTLSAFTGDYILINPTRTLTSGSITDTGNFLELNRSNTIDGAAGFTLSGDLARFTSNCIEASGTCNDSSRILLLAQNFPDATGQALAIDNAGSGASLAVMRGNVGIGTSSTSGGSLIVASGNVGIGFTSPQRPLMVASDINIVGSNSSLLGNNGSQFAITGSSGTGGTEKKLVLGIDTTDNYGVIQAGNTSGTNYTLSLNPAGGNVGIGTTIPLYTLDVTGNVGISQSLTVSNVIVANAGINVTGLANLTGNVGIGGSLTLSTFKSCNQVKTDSSGVVTCGVDGGLESVQVFTRDNQGANAYNAPSIITHIVVELVGGGGGGGGTDGGVTKGGAGGGAGGYSSELLESFSANEDVTVGVGGSGGMPVESTGSEPGGTDGGTTSFGDSVYLQATGGTGGAPGHAVGTAQDGNGGSGGIGSGGDINLGGGGGGFGTGTVVTASFSGSGGASYFGGGGGGVTEANVGGQQQNGVNGLAPGSGGGGGAVFNGVGATGGNGAQGIVIVWEYSGNAGSDYAEYYDTASDVEAADLVSVSDYSITIDPKSLTDGLSNLAVLQKAKIGDSLIGVVSTSPGQTIGQEIVPFSKHPKPIALSGRVPVKVSTESGAIKKGDKLTASSIPGVAMKSFKAGQIIGTALEDFDGSSCDPPDPPPEGSTDPPPICQGKINVFINTSYSAGLRTAELLAKQGLDIDNLAEGLDVGKILLAQLLIEKKDIVDQTKVAEVATDRLIAGLEVITPRVVANEVVVDKISPVSDSGMIYLDGNLGIGGSGFLGIQDNNIVLGSETETNLAFKTNNNIVVTIDTLGNLEAEGSVIAPSIVTSEIEIASDSAKLAVKNDLGEEIFSLDKEGNLKTKLVKADKLLIPAGTNLALDPSTSILSYESTLLANGDTSYEVDVYQSLKNLEEKVVALEDQVHDIAGSEATSSAELADDTYYDLDQELASLDLTPPEILLASGSAQLDELYVGSDAAIEGTLIAYNTEIQNQFQVFGTTTLSDTLIAGNFTVDGTLSIENGSEINVLGTLFLQKSILADSLDIFDGKVIIDKDGAIRATSITADQFKINDGQSAGIGKILAGQTEVIIENPYVSDTSVIVTTPNVPLTQTIAVTDKVKGQFFTVKIAEPESLDIPFDYLIIGISQETPAPISQSPGGGT